MITKLLQRLEQNQGEIDLSVLSRELGAQPSAAAGMLEFLIQKGRVIEVGADCGVCSACVLHDQCLLPAKRARQFLVVKRSQTGGSSPRDTV